MPLDLQHDDILTLKKPHACGTNAWRVYRLGADIGQGFENAFAAYKSAGQKLKQFNDFYFDYASYMKAWSEIELAKCAHNEDNFEGAARHYEKASQLLRKSKSWLYLSLNFYAWALLEQAEDLSRKENSVEAIEKFEKAIKSLHESKRFLKEKLDDIDGIDERNLVTKLVQVSDMRSEYSHGRIAVEEAKIFNKKGDHVGSSNKYDKAAAIFQKISLEDSGHFVVI